MMSHHGNDPDAFRRLQGQTPGKTAPELKMARESLTRALLDTTGFRGATGLFPDGKLKPDDEGGIQFAVGSEGDKVVVDFGTSVHWLAMDAQQAADLASSLLKAARTVGRKTGQTIALNLSIP